MLKTPGVLAALLALAAPAASDAGAAAPDPLQPVSTGGVAVVERALARLSGHRRLMVVGAHPDDEDNTILAWAARGVAAEAAYLALSRGEGGQNLIGRELGTGLGLIRTGELLAARRVEGTRQLFSRAFDFGYTRSLDETFRRWPREVLLEDAVRAVRRFRPQVVVAIFPGDERAGHGQHQASGVIAAEVMEVAGEPDRYPVLTAAGLPPWRPQALYRRAWSGDEATQLFSLDAVEPLAGRSLAQIAAASRSLHRSQDMGREQRIGGGRGGLIWRSGGAGPEGDDAFAGIDVRLEAIAAPLGADGEALAVRLRRVEEMARRAHGELRVAHLDASVPALAGIVRELSAALPGMRDATAAALVREKLAIASEGLAAAAGLAFEAVADRETAVAGEPLAVEASLWNGGDRPVAVGPVALRAAPGWWREQREPGSSEAGPGETVAATWRAGVAPGTPPTLPYFLRRPRHGDLYDWTGAPEEVRGEPYQPPPLTAVFEIEVAGAEIRVEREVVHRYGDQAVGEVRRPLRAVPAVEVATRPDLVLWRIGSAVPPRLEVTVGSHREAPVSGRLEVGLEGGWRAEGGGRFRLEGAGRSHTFRLRLLRPATPAPAALAVSVTAELDDGGRYAAAYPLIEYPHVRPVPIEVPAAAKLEVLDLDLPALGRIGYVRGASDRVPELLAEVGLPVELLDPERLAVGELDGYDAIVVGSRAYETDPALRRANGRLLDYARGGGLLVVQYQQYQFVRGGFAPYPLTIAQPHGRVTDEGSPVETPLQDDPVLARPNRISAADWRGWVQERGLYFADTWDPAYRAPLVMTDPGQPPQRGSLLIAPLGDGTYVYTGLAFFRQLPAGVPGAYRLFANLLALAEGETR
ncbi:MAG: PIG-L family deacetylase [Thermoanaerobaculia bacterium]|nr:PIG-L family deacetylase [Thermoanaerobaculia bacterium]